MAGEINLLRCVHAGHPGFYEATGQAALYFFTLPANRMSVLGY